METPKITVQETRVKKANIQRLVVSGHHKNVSAYTTGGESSEPQSIVINEGVRTIEPFSFCGNALRELVLPASIERIGVSAFDGFVPENMIIRCYSETFSEIYSHYLSPNKIEYGSGKPFSKEFTKEDADKFIDEEIVIIPHGITAIGKEAFANNTKIRHITIPDSVIFIEQFAFDNCVNLRSVKMSNATKMIGWSAFKACENLTVIDLPDSLVLIGAGAFAYCKGIKSLKIPSLVNHIGSGIFAYCNQQINIRIENNSSFYVEAGVLYGIDGTVLWVDPKIAEVTFSNKCKYIGGWSFADSFAQKVVLPDSVEYISSQAFYNCHSLEYVYIPQSVRNISSDAFYDCPNATIFCESNLYIESFVEKYNVNLKIIEKEIMTKETVSYLKNNSNLKLSDFKIIPRESFKNNKTITNITISKVAFIGQEAFYNCDSLTNVIINSNLHSIDEWAFANCKNIKCISLKEVRYIGSAAFAGSGHFDFSIKSEYYQYTNGLLFGNEDGRLIWASPKLKGNITIPGDITIISLCAFMDCKNINSIEIPLGVTKIEDWAFLNCKKLNSIRIPENVTDIGFDVFVETNDLFKIHCYKDSVAEQYAINNNICYELIENEVIV